MANMVRHLALAAVAGLTVLSCDSVIEPGPATGGAVATGATLPTGGRAGRTVTGDVEAPDIFSTTDQGLWDGRPSLGGVWIASPEATDPERVLIRNPANDKSVVGALFRRERENPGPRLQVSSDAAAALGMLAGAPVELTVVALRRSESPQPAPVTDPVSPELPEDQAAASEAGGPQPLTAAAADASAPERRRPFWRRRDAIAEPVTDTAATPPDVTAAANPRSAPASARPGPAPTADLRSDVAAPTAGQLIQIGIFSVEANARKAAADLAKAGVPTEVKRDGSNGKVFWRVVAVPDSAADRAGLMTKVNSLGFKDAFFVAR